MAISICRISLEMCSAGSRHKLEASIKGRALPHSSIIDQHFLYILHRGADIAESDLSNLDCVMSLLGRSRPCLCLYFDVKFCFFLYVWVGGCRTQS